MNVDIKIDFGAGYVPVSHDNESDFEKTLFVLNELLEVSEVNFISNFADFETAKLTQTSLPVKFYRDGVLILTAKVILPNDYDFKKGFAKLIVKPADNDILALIEQNLDEEYNIIARPTIPRVESKLTYSTILFFVYEKETFTTPIPPTGFVLKGSDSNDIPLYSPTKNYEIPKYYGINNYSGKQSYVRYSGVIYMAIDASFGDYPDVSPTKWEAIPSAYVYTIDLSLSKFVGYDYTTEWIDFLSSLHPEQFTPEINTDLYYYTYPTSVNSTLNFVFSNGSELRHVIKDFVSKMTNNQVLFEIDNTVSPNYFCPVFVGTDYEYLHVHDVSDIMFSTGQIGAFQTISFKNLTEAMFTQFNLKWIINENGYFQFIHPTDNLYSGELDVRKYTTDKGSYSTEMPNVSEERFENINSGNTQFDSLRIIYANKGTADAKSNSKVCNNILILVAGDNSDVQSKNAICFIPVDSLDNVLVDANGLPDRMQWINLLTEFLQYERPMRFGTVDGVQYEFTTVGMTSGGSFKLPEANIEDIDMFTLIKTETSEHLGTLGRIKSIKQKFADDSVDIEYTI